jgi:thiol-disulfide isomerase/thioredoxin
MKRTIAASMFFVLACGGSATPLPGGEVKHKAAVEEPQAAVQGQAEPAPEPAPPAEPEAELAPSEKPAIYEEAAITDAAFDEALARAKAEHKHVLLMFGGNWCGWCHKLHELMEADPKIKSTLEGGFVRVMVDSHTNDALIEKLDIELKGVPYLVVLDAAGEILVRQETGSLEDGPKHDPGRVLAFLVEWRPPA